MNPLTVTIGSRLLECKLRVIDSLQCGEYVAVGDIVLILDSDKTPLYKLKKIMLATE